MKKIVIATFISCTVLSSAFATAPMLQPSLGAQMARQEQINKKNVVQARIAERNRTIQEAKNALVAKQYQLFEQRNRTQQSKPLVPKLTIAPIPPKLIPTILSQAPTPSVIVHPNVQYPKNVDMGRVTNTWLGWTNSVRSTLSLSPYAIDTRLNSTAYDWNIEFAKGRGQNHHRRNPSDSYYDFQVIDQWFGSRGINPTVINRAKNTENVGYGYYNCSSGDCTDSLIHSIRSTFDFFMSEKGKANDSHYRSIVQPYFSKIGLSVIVVPSEQRYYITVHYITQ